MIDGGAEVRADPAGAGEEGRTHGSMSVCVVTDGRLRTPMNAGFRQNLTVGSRSRFEAPERRV